jgi:pimeloyl-ACP methyl ester carboxylesterase
LLPLTGIPQVVRRPFWDRGAANILFVINTLKQRKMKFNFKNITLIGHSNGGDMTALFPQQYPGVVQQIITLDNRRMALPLDKKIRVLSLRSKDQKADEGVLPDIEYIARYGMKIIPLVSTKHNDMDDSGTPTQHEEIVGYIMDFLSKR